MTTNRGDDYANGDVEPTWEDLIEEGTRLGDTWSEELDRDVQVDYSLKHDEWVVEIDGVEFGRYISAPQIDTALSVLMNGG